jgi:hypothetical protein
MIAEDAGGAEAALGTGQADLDGDGQITLKELVDWIRPRVAREARRLSREQTPSVALGTALGDGQGLVVVQGLEAR